MALTIIRGLGKVESVIEIMTWFLPCLFSSTCRKKKTVQVTQVRLTTVGGEAYLGTYIREHTPPL